MADDRYELFRSLSFGLDRATWLRIGGLDEAFADQGLVHWDDERLELADERA